MRDPTGPPADAELSLTALRYAAGDMPPADAEAFEARLGTDQAAREALAEAVRLSAAASGAPVPTPDPLVRLAAAERLHPTWLSRLFPRRPYRGHPALWAGLGGGIAAAVAVGVAVAEPPEVIAVVPTGDMTTPPVFVSVPPLPTDARSHAVSLTPAPPGASPASTRLNPMGMQKRPADAVGAASAAPVFAPTPTGTPPAGAAAGKRADDKLAEGPAEANPMGEPRVGMTMSRL
jgi:hypothetical protein